MVLFLYVIMMLNLNSDVEPHKNKWLKVAATITGGLLMIILVGALKKVSENSLPTTPNIEIGLVKNLGNVLFNEFALPFEVSSILFLAAMVGAVMLGKKEIK